MVASVGDFSVRWIESQLLVRMGRKGDTGTASWRFIYTALAPKRPKSTTRPRAGNQNRSLRGNTNGVGLGLRQSPCRHPTSFTSSSGTPARFLRIRSVPHPRSYFGRCGCRCWGIWRCDDSSPQTSADQHISGLWGRRGVDSASGKAFSETWPHAMATVQQKSGAITSEEQYSVPVEPLGLMVVVD
jgi:hypothetical protein